MISRHVDKSASTRVPPEVLDEAKRELKAAGWTLFGFLGACLATAARQPAAILAIVAEHRPAEKPHGRPRKAQPDHSSPA